MSPSKPPPFIVFYSFKGGVGRSMALINVAALLAARGRRVLALDLDLEAPGISYLLQKEHGEDVPGFIDLLFDFFAEQEKSAMSIDAGAKAILQYTHVLSLPEKLRQGNAGVLRIMPAGRMDADYETRRQQVDLNRLYRERKGKPLMKRFREMIIKSREFDYVLIDSRTGFSDEAGISIRDLGDHLVILHGLNRQNVEGTARFVERIRRTVPDRYEVHFVASPIPIGEDTLREARIQEAERRFSDVWKKTVQLKYQIPYHPRLALDEEPAIFHNTSGALYDAYAAIEGLVRQLSRDTASDWALRGQDQVKVDDEQALACFREAQRLGGLPVSILSSACHAMLGEASFNAYWDLLVEAEGGSTRPTRAALDLAIKHFEISKDNDKLEALYRDLLAQEPDHVPTLCAFGKFLRQVRDKPGEAEDFYRRALDLHPNDPAIISELATLLWRNYQRADEAERLYRSALEINPHDAQITSLFGTFMWYGRKDYDEAERLFYSAMKMAPNDENIVGRLANFLWKVRKASGPAENLYIRALGLRPDHGTNLCNYSGYLLAVNKLQLAPLKQMLPRAWAASFRRQDQITAEVALYRGMQLRLERQSDAVPLGYLKRLFQIGFPRMLWSFDEVLRMTGEKFGAEDYQLYLHLAEAVLDASKLSQLESSRRWHHILPKEIGVDI